MALRLKDLDVGESFEITDGVLNGETGTVVRQHGTWIVARLDGTKLLGSKHFPLSSTLLCRSKVGG